jgi:hypothetical protein
MMPALALPLSAVLAQTCVPELCYGWSKELLDVGKESTLVTANCLKAIRFNVDLQIGSA